ncbi:hypothetical protein BH18GEM1_BH18GEM1_21590 [soil metagenome]
MVRAGLLGLMVAVGLVLLPGCGEEPMSGLDQSAGSLSLNASKKKLDVSICDPSQGGFSIQSTNPYFPLHVGHQWKYEGDEDGEFLELLITVLNETRVIDGVTTRILEEREWVDDELLEVSWNYFAETSDGTVCYFGEDVDIFEDDEIVHDGAWCADEPGNHAGIFMPADPKPGMKYPNEIAPGIAEDFAKIIGSGPVTVPAGRFTKTIRVEETTPLEPGKGYKVFAAETGLVIDGPAELVSFIQGAGQPLGPIPTNQVCGL